MMGRAKEEMLVKEENLYAAAERAGRRCSFCGSVISYAEPAFGDGKNVCGHCHNSMAKDD
jgi:formylmethanofuran dehydrogenase subunit E